MTETKRYKICFIASDGTDEAEVICFGDIARRIIGKSVQQVLRTATIQNAYPPDITKIVNQRFTFAVVLTHQSYYRHQKTYQVSSVITSYGNRDAAPVAPAPVDGGAAADLQIQAPPADGTDEDPQHMSPHSVKETDLSSQSVENVESHIPNFWVSLFFFVFLLHMIISICFVDSPSCY